MNYKISHPTKNIKCLIDLPPSKSISNRLLIIKSLCKEDLKIKNLSLCDDTIVLKNGLKKNHGKIDIGHAGTSLRFLTAYFAIQKNREYILTGSNRVKERPIKELVDALRTLGAKIEYLQNEGFAPLKISGAELVGKEIEINGNISSQFISALLLVAPSIKNGLSLKIKGNLVSSSYINMTLRLMNYFGVKSTWKNKKIEIKEQNYMGREIQVEADWSSASFWYEIACISKKCNIVLKGLSKDSIQGDKALTDIYSDLGVISNFDLNLLSLKKSDNFSYKKKN